MTDTSYETRISARVQSLAYAVIACVGARGGLLFHARLHVFFPSGT